ncbi:Ig-like domain repeat protein [Gordonia sp. ABSL49_1]|uniref:Ig-like domain repeat protein n=1 Tax=unclassified Gordonia (in: high G+C Gram-positive bacteria) TaxID=2657482 RepID=UPI001F0D955A|nr:Ig-like domain repeat protein [Gordonia sp. ABSL49_1]MCH5641258.1 Ig-like domain repeat protein [Gordonia sp. ABSL49_1]
MQPFVANDYRKRVLAAVDRRGGVDASDPFELYDIPLDEAESLTDAEVSRRIDEVWAFWQKQRDHPKYRVLVGQLVAEHEQRSESLRFANRRSALARTVTATRDQRDADRFELLDSAIERLMQRHGGIPASKRSGLDDIGAMGGLTPAEIATRLRRYRILDDSSASTPLPAPTPELSSARLEQIATLLGEFDRLQVDERTPTLLSLLRLTLDDATDLDEIGRRTAQLGERSRELPAGRLRAVVDELLVHIREILLGDVGLARAYSAAVMTRVRSHLEPRIRAAVLVEDELLEHDREFLVQEALSLGLGPVGARAMVDEIATDFGAAAPKPTVEARPAVGPEPARRSREWEAPLRSARAMLRQGKPVAARTLCREALDLAGDDSDAIRQIRSVTEEVENLLADAKARWRRALDDAGADRHVAALAALDELSRTASDIDTLDVHGPQLSAALEVSRRAVAAAESVVAQSKAGGVGPAVLAAAARACADHPELARMTAQVSVEPATDVRVTVLGGVACHITWQPSATPGVVYRVLRLRADGSSQTVGRTSATELEDGGATPGAVPPSYGVVALLGGLSSDIARSDGGAAVARVSESRSAPSSPDIVVRGVVDGRLRFDWPVGVTEAMVVIRPDQPPSDPADPQARGTKITNTRYEIDGGFVLPAGARHVAVASCRRDERGALHTATAFGPQARAVVDSSRLE